MTSPPDAKAESAAVWSARLTRLDGLLLVLVLGLSLFFRFWQQGQIPPGMDFDEAFESLEAHRILTEPGYHPIFFYANNGVPPVKIYLTALAFAVAGENGLSIRYVSGIVGTLTILALYVLVRVLFPQPLLPPETRVKNDLSLLPRDRGAGGATLEAGGSRLTRRFMPFVASVLLAVLPWHTAFSRHGIEVILLPLWATLAVLFLWQGLRAPPGWWYFAFSGLFWGSVLYTYQAGALLPGVLILFVIYKVLQEHGFLRRCGRQLILLVVVATLVVLPLAQVARTHPEALALRAGQTTIFTHGQGSERPLLSLARNTLAVAGLFVFGGDIAKTDNIFKRPPLPLILALTLLAGLLVAALRFKRAEYGLLLIWFVWMLFPSILTENAPSIRRAIGSVPPMVILMALGIGWLFDEVQSSSLIHRPPAPVVGKVSSNAHGLSSAFTGLAVGALLVCAVLWGYRYYFVEWASDKDLFHYFDVGLVDTGRFAASTPAGTRLYYTPVADGSTVYSPLKWPLRDRELRTFDGRYGLVMAPAGPQQSLYLITAFLGDSWSLPALQRIYPTGQVVHEVRNLYGVPHSLVFAVDPETAPSPSVQNPVSANFENEIALLGSNLSSTELHASETLTVTLFWRSLSGPTPLGRTVFTHLVGPKKAEGSPVWAGHDSQPLNNSYPTVRWAQGEIIADQHEFDVPADAPPGTYTVEAGLYTPQQGGARLRILDSAGWTPELVRDPSTSAVVGTVFVR
jgi:Dolichyl-phosphate-mannose-protein mannosyltransferase